MDLQQLTYWDWFVVVSAAVSVGLGLWNGLLRTVFHLAAWLVGVISATVGPSWIDVGAGNKFAGLWLPILFFIAGFIVTRLIGHFAGKGVNKLGLAPVDRMAGALFGFARAALIVAVVIAAARMLNWHQGEQWQQSVSRPVLDAVLSIVEPWLPDATRGVQRT
jgi:membrane protein required for colicin V production